MTEPTPTSPLYVARAELEAGLAHVRGSPRDRGVLVWIARRPGPGGRKVLARAELSTHDGLVGDDWRVRGSSKTSDGSAHPDKQLTIANARATALVARTQERWALAGDQLYVDFDLSLDHVPPGTRLAIGEAVVELTPAPHTGCRKYAERFGAEALAFVNAPDHRPLRLRGVNARVIRAGHVRVGDVVTRWTA